MQEWADNRPRVTRLRAWKALVSRLALIDVPRLRPYRLRSDALHQPDQLPVIPLRITAPTAQGFADARDQASGWSAVARVLLYNQLGAIRYLMAGLRNVFGGPRYMGGGERTVSD
jgi:hypothetical protein